MSDNIRITDPPHGSTNQKNVAFDATVEHQVHGFTQGFAALQFSNTDQGPWLTCRPPGDGGALEAPTLEATSQQSTLQFTGCLQHEAVWTRAAFWNQGTSMEQTPDFTGDPARWRLVSAVAMP